MHEVGLHRLQGAGEEQMFTFGVMGASQGEEGYELAKMAYEMNSPFTVALIDMRMPPGWDGLTTAQKLRELDPRIFIVIVTAYTDRSIEEIQEVLQFDALLIYKPFTGDEIFQLARTLCISWNNRQQKQEAFDEIERLASYPQESPCPILRFSEEGELLYRNPHSDPILSLMDVTVPGDRLTGAWAKRVRSVYQDGRVLEVEVGNGDSFFLVTLAPIHERSYINCYVTDITRRYLLNRQLTYQARHDPLTGLTNRNEFLRKLNLVMRRIQDQGGEYAVLYLDLEHFKEVNDTAGHLVGDQTLQTLSGYLLNELKDGDILCRIGGDEFAMLLYNVTVDQARGVARRIGNAVRKNRYEWRGLEFKLDVFIGIAMLRKDYLTDAREVINRADQACYAAKEMEGGDRTYIYHLDQQEVEDQSQAVVLANEVREAISNGQFQLYLQPVEMRGRGTADPVHHEVLLRMESNGGDVVSPVDFLPNSERFDLVPALDRWVVTHTFKRLKGATDGNSYSINLSGGTLVSEGFNLFVRDQLKRYGVVPKTIVFEIPESIAYQQMTMVQRFISEMHELGVRVAIDNYGSMDRSFSSLQKLPVDMIKISGRLSQGVIHNPLELAMIKSILHVGEVLGLEVAATSVENREIAEALVNVGVHYLQGFHIGRPVQWV